MIKNAVFVLGAGASCPYGFPSGKELRQEICGHYVSEYTHYLNTYKRTIVPIMPQEQHKAREFTDTFRESSTQSIDLFISRNPEFRDMGKRAIIFRILGDERGSFFGEAMGENATQDWYTWLFGKLTDELVKKGDYERFGENDVSFITFNYDRSLEHFLYRSLVKSFNGIPADRIQEQLEQIRICHVFGRVGPLEWQAKDGGVEYGAPVASTDVDALCNNIRIVYEEEDSPELKEARNVLSTASRVFFLGFGYAKENLDALKIPKVLANCAEIDGTALGFTKGEIEAVKYLSFKGHPALLAAGAIENLDCLALLRERLHD